MYINQNLFSHLFTIFLNTGLAHGQEKSGIFFLNGESQEKIGGFEKKSGNLIKFKAQL